MSSRKNRRSRLACCPCRQSTSDRIWGPRPSKPGPKWHSPGQRGAAVARVVSGAEKFKGSVAAVEAAEAIALGVRDALPDAVIETCPVADGGEGTLDVLYAAGARPGGPAA